MIPCAIALLLGVGACSAFLPDVGPPRGGAADGGPGLTEGGSSDGSTDAGADSPGSKDAAPSTFTVVVAPNGDHTFAPQDLTIRVGDKVHWVWESSGHTVTSGAGGNADGRFCSPSDGACTSTTTSGAGATYDHTFTSAGTFPYFCRPHRSSGMTGSVIVQ